MITKCVVPSNTRTVRRGESKRPVAGDGRVGRSFGRGLIALITCAMVWTVLGFGLEGGVWAGGAAPSEREPVDLAKLDRVLQEMVDDLYANAEALRAKGLQTNYVRLEGIGWESPEGDIVGTSALGALINERLELALSKRSVVLSPEETDGAKGFFGATVRGAFKVLRAGVRVTLRLVDRNTGNSLSEVSRELGFEFFPDIAEADIKPPGAQDAQALGGLVRRALGGTESDFDLRVSTDRGSFGSYTVGEKVTIFVESAEDCYVRLYHLSWDDRTLTLIFPNKAERESRLRAGEVRRFPGESRGYSFEVAKPYGVDVIVAVASLESFGDEEEVSAQWSGGSEPAETSSNQDYYPDYEDDFEEDHRHDVELDGDYLVARDIDEERFQEIMAKGLILKYEEGSGERTSGTYRSGDPSSSGLVVAPSRQGKARATCSFVTVRKLF